MRSKTRIGMILKSGFPPDIRVEKEAKALTKAGFETFLLAEKILPSEKEYEITNYGLHIFRYEIKQSSKVRQSIEKIVLFYPKWYKVIWKYAKNTKPHFLHVHDLDILPTALSVGLDQSIPVIVDLHENYPAIKKSQKKQLKFPFSIYYGLTRNYHLLRWHEKRTLKKCSRIIVVVPEAAQRLIKNYHIPKSKLFIVSNTEDKSTFSLTSLDDKILGQYQNSWNALYIGGMGPHRGIDTAIRSAAYVSKYIPHFKLLIVGVENNSSRAVLQKLINSHQVSNQVKLIGWIPFNKVISYISASHVCLVPHNDSEHTQTTIPHKLFQYMLMKKPVIVSDCKPLQRIVKMSNSGLIFKANDPKSLADCLVQLYQGGEMIWKKLGENGAQAAIKIFSWENDAKTLIQMYNNLSNQVK